MTLTSIIKTLCPISRVAKYYRPSQHRVVRYQVIIRRRIMCSNLNSIVNFVVHECRRCTISSPLDCSPKTWIPNEPRILIPKFQQIHWKRQDPLALGSGTRPSRKECVNGFLTTWSVLIDFWVTFHENSVVQVGLLPYIPFTYPLLSSLLCSLCILSYYSSHWNKTVVGYLVEVGVIWTADLFYHRVVLDAVARNGVIETNGDQPKSWEIKNLPKVFFKLASFKLRF